MGGAIIKTTSSAWALILCGLVKLGVALVMLILDGETVKKLKDAEEARGPVVAESIESESQDNITAQEAQDSQAGLTRQNIVVEPSNVVN